MTHIKSCISSILTAIDNMSRKQTPSEFLKQIIGRPVVVKLNSGVDYRGMCRHKKANCIEIDGIGNKTVHLKKSTGMYYYQDVIFTKAHFDN